jgi:hypothetical protein
LGVPLATLVAAAVLGRSGRFFLVGRLFVFALLILVLLGFAA